MKNVKSILLFVLGFGLMFAVPHLPLGCNNPIGNILEVIAFASLTYGVFIAPRKFRPGVVMGGMPTPGGMGGGMASVGGGAASSVMQQGRKSPAIISNNLGALSEFKITMVTDGTGIAGAIAILPGPVPGLLSTAKSVTVPDQNHLTLTSSVSASGAYAEFKQFLNNVGMHIKYIRITVSADTSLYTGSLFIGEVPVNGNINPTEIVLSDYTTVIGGNGTYDKTLKITDRNIAITKNFFMYFSSMPISNTVTIAFGVDAIGDAITTTATGN